MITQLMYISPFLAGALSVFFIELLAIAFGVLFWELKNSRKSNDTEEDVKKGSVKNGESNEKSN